MNFTIRKTKPEDFEATVRITREAFLDRSRFPVKGPVEEHFVLYNLRNSEDYIPELDFLAEDENGVIIAHIVYSHAAVQGENGTCHPAITFGPVSVVPTHQSKGIGSALIEYTLQEAKRLGYTRVVLQGHPWYYPRFGFRPAREFGITPEYDACMVLALIPGAFRGVHGKVMETPAFVCSRKALAAFDRQFTE